ncbi:GCN5 family acetyltransferase [Haloprofundus marisrubri]|uniref:GCN5 family acetyltransferase n=1 Tax=Haloprofundus marisrubri TaxID=1514971 RepID=A0A0W1R4I0_9EURY|nr:GNAT family N-acetyltransferase [Haloprofundus marisrubri]KTG08013.1 GCN5 family acetyltransferase [Haloprofundus marisrubri]
MEIRPAKTNDIEAIRRVARQSWAATYDDILGSETVEETVSEWYSDETLSDALDRPGTAFLVAEIGDGSVDDGGKLIGFCHGVVEAEQGDVVRLYVDPDHWREGVGSALYDRLRSDLEDFNMKRVEAIVLADNEMGNEFYRHLGFEHTGEGEVTMGGESYRENVYTKELAQG